MGHMGQSSQALLSVNFPFPDLLRPGFCNTACKSFTMKWFFTLGIMLMLACTGSKNATTDIQLNGDWELVLFPAGGKEFAEIFGQRKPELQFDALNKRVSGTTGCNRISGQYTRDTTMFRFADNLLMTKMACPGYDENVFLETMNKVNRALINGNQLSFLQDSTVLMTFAKRQ